MISSALALEKDMIIAADVIIIVAIERCKNFMESFDGYRHTIYVFCKSAGNSIYDF